jgi:hypothetical protein
VPAAGGRGIPVVIENGGDATELELRVSCDGDLLALRGARVLAAGPPGAEIAFSASGPGAALIRVRLPAPAGDRRQVLFALAAEVPPDAPYGARNVLRIGGEILGGGAVTSARALHLVCYPGDITANAGYSALDAAGMVAAGAGSDRRVARCVMPFADDELCLLGDADGDGALELRDARLVLEAAAGLEPPEIPRLPGILEPTAAEGPDPTVRLPTDSAGRPGETVRVPVLLDQAEGLEAVELELEFDPAVLTAAAAAVVPGELLAHPEAIFALNVVGAAGSIRFAAAIPDPHVPGAGSLLDIEFTIAETAAGGTTPVNLVRASLNEDGLVLTPEPTPDPGEEIDGRVTVLAGEPAAIEASPAAVDFGEVTVGAAATAEVTVRSTGGASLEIAAVRIEGADAASFAITRPLAAASLAPGESGALEVTFAPAVPGDHEGELAIESNAANAPRLVVPLAGAGRAPGAGPLIRGDSNGDGAINIADPTFTLNYLFIGGAEPPCLAAANANGDAALVISDPIYELNYLFIGGPWPPAPFPACGASSNRGDLELGCRSDIGCRR